ncbi:mhkC [Symbiodinium microadriaticum]|nr:mhkC [Symbiodinium microadriaticum]
MAWWQKPRSFRAAGRRPQSQSRPNTALTAEVEDFLQEILKEDDAGKANRVNAEEQLQRNSLQVALGPLHKTGKKLTDHTATGGLYLKYRACRTTDDIASKAFQNGFSLDNTIDKFATGALSAEHFESSPLQVVWHDGFLWSLSNRRLYVFRVAHALGCCSVCPCHIHSTSTKIISRLEDALSTTTGGKIVNIRGGSSFSDLQCGHPISQQAIKRLQLPTIEQFLQLAKASMGATESEMNAYHHSLSTNGFSSVSTLFELAYFQDPAKLGIPFRLQHCIVQLLQRAEPFHDCVNRCSDTKQPHEKTLSNVSTKWPPADTFQIPQAHGDSAGWTSTYDFGNTYEWAANTVQDFACRRELTRTAKRDLEQLAPFEAADVVRALEAEKRGIPLQPAEWSKIVSSRCSAKASAGEMDHDLLVQIEEFMRDIGMQGHFTAETLGELGSTLRSFSSQEAYAVMNDHQFVSSVPRGLITDPAAVAQQIAKQIRRSLVEAKIQEFVSSFEYSHATGELLRQLCRVNPSKADTLMQHHKASHGEASLVWRITQGASNRYVGKSTHPSQVENHRQLESEWSDDEGVHKLDTQQGREKTDVTDRLQNSGDGNIEQTNEAVQGRHSEAQVINGLAWPASEHGLTWAGSSYAGDHADKSNKSTHEVGAQSLLGEKPGEPSVGGQAATDPDDASDSDAEDEDVVGDLPSWNQSLEHPSISTLSVGSWSTTRHESNQVSAHYIVVLDTSGSMSSQDCCAQDGTWHRRIDAVKLKLSEFARDMGRQQLSSQTSDIYSFVTFNMRFKIQFALQPADIAAVKLERVRVEPRFQTSYSSGFDGIRECVRQADQYIETSGRPTYVMFISDGEPWDADEFMAKLSGLMQACPRMQINAVAFGHACPGTAAHRLECRAVDYLYYLQQLAAIGGGICTWAGTSLASIKGAFRAVRSTMTTTRKKQSLQAGATQASSASKQWTSSRQQVEVRDDDGSWTSASILRLNATARTCEVILCSGGSCQIKELPWKSVHWPSDTDIPFVPELEPAKPSRVLATWEGWEPICCAQRLHYRFDGKRFQVDDEITTTVTRRLRYFTKGSMRIVRYMHDQLLGGKLLVCKQLLAPGGSAGSLAIKSSCKASMEPFCRNTAVARYFAKRFRQRGYCLGFLQDYLYCLDDLPRAQEQSQVFMGEMHMDGVFVKFNNNGGSVNKEDHKHHCDLAQAFSHFTFDQSYGELLVVDIQGVPSVQSDGKTVLHLTDPQVHSRHNNFPSFGEGDLKEAGIRKFFATHRCSRICEALKLKRASDYDFLPPRITLTIPGLSHEFWKELSTRTLQKVRRQFRLADIVYPNEIIGEDLEVKLWGRLKNTSQAAQEPGWIKPFAARPAWQNMQAISCSLEQLLHECCHPIWFEDAGFYLHQIQAMAPWSVRAFGWPRGGSHGVALRNADVHYDCCSRAAAQPRSSASYMDAVLRLGELRNQATIRRSVKQEKAELNLSRGAPRV